MNRLTYSIVGLFIFIATEALLMAYVDRPIAEWAHNLDTTNPTIINFFRAYTDIGKAVWYLWPSGLLILLIATIMRLSTPPAALLRWCRILAEPCLFFFIVIATSGVAINLVKRVVGRARPVEFFDHQFYGVEPLTLAGRFHSWPSGHSTTAFALAFALSYLMPRYRIFWWSAAIALAVSRVMVNAHYTADVVAGLAAAYTCYALTRWGNAHYGMIHARRWLFPIDKNRQYH